MSCSVYTLLPQFKYSMPRPHLPPQKRQEPINSFIFYINKKTKAEKPIYFGKRKELERETERERKRASLSVRTEMR